MTPPQRTADYWRYAALRLTALALLSQSPGKPTCAAIACSIDEDNILERLLAEYWDAKDRSAVYTNWGQGSGRPPRGKQTRRCNSNYQKRDRYARLPP